MWFCVCPGGGSSRGRRQRRGEDVVHPLKVSLDDLYNGTSKKLSLSRNVICSKCKGWVLESVNFTNPHSLSSVYFIALNWSGILMIAVKDLSRVLPWSVLGVKGLEWKFLSGILAHLWSSRCNILAMSVKVLVKPSMTRIAAHSARVIRSLGRRKFWKLVWRRECRMDRGSHSLGKLMKQ